MKRNMTTIIQLAMATLLISCSGAPKKTETVPVALEGAQSLLITAPPVWQSVADVQAACAEHLDLAREIRTQLVSPEGERSALETLETVNQMLIEVDRVLPLSELVANVNPDEKVREAGEKCQQDAMKFISELELDRQAYEAIAAVSKDGLDELATRFLDHLLRDYKRSGVDKDEAVRQKLATLKEEMVKVGQTFSKAIREDQRFIEVTKEELAGLPEDFLNSHQANENGKIKITTDYPDFQPVAKYADSEETRKAIYIKFLERAYPANEETFKKLLSLRHEYATILGYEDWAAYNSEDKMAKDKKTISALIEKVTALARPRMESDKKEILERKKKDVKKAKVVQTWDRFYYVSKIKNEKYGVDAQEVRAYFDYQKVKEGLLELNQEIYGVNFKKIEDATVWSEGVEAYDIYDGEELIARFYLDMHPRKGKYGHAAMFPLLTGINGVQLPAASLVCNFPQSEGDAPALMEHGQVTTFFHEFGHLMHHLLAGRHDWVTLSGINCEWDFVEAPSQIMEEWAWDYDVLKRFAKHHETAEVIPEELVKKMQGADSFGKGVHVMRQMFYAGLSFAYHSRNPEGIDLMGVVKEMQEKYNPYPFTEGTYVFANFGHLEGYSSMYYTYIWSLVVAKDLFTRFTKDGLLNKATAKEYRDMVLAPGGSRDAALLVNDFLGRDYTFDAFKAYMEKN
jgi:Zn-dependent oligopeptidase